MTDDKDDKQTPEEWFEELVQKMQTPESKQAVKGAFYASPEDFAATFKPVPDLHQTPLAPTSELHVEKTMARNTKYHTIKSVPVTWTIWDWEGDCTQQSEFLPIFKAIHNETSLEDISIADPNPNPGEVIGTMFIPEPHIFRNPGEYTYDVVVENNMKVMYLTNTINLDKIIGAISKKMDCKINFRQSIDHRIPVHQCFYRPENSQQQLPVTGDIEKDGRFVRSFLIEVTFDTQCLTVVNHW